MKYEVLTPKKTSVWLSNYQKTLELYRLMYTVSDEILDSRLEMVKQKYLNTRFKRIWNGLWRGLEDITDVHVGYYSGQFYTMGGLLWAFGLKVPDYTVRERQLSWFCNDMSDSDERLSEHQWLLDLAKHWNQYATKPFHVEKDDVQDYLNLCRLHAEMKELLVSLGKYDEALDLADDS